MSNRKSSSYKQWLRPDGPCKIPRKTISDRQQRQILVSAAVPDNCNETVNRDINCEVTDYQFPSSSVIQNEEDESSFSRDGELTDFGSNDVTTYSDVENLLFVYDDVITNDIDEGTDEDMNTDTEELRHNKNNNQPLYRGAEIDRSVAELLIVMFSIRHKLTDVGIQDLLELINCIVGTRVFGTKYMLLKKFDNHKIHSLKQYFCNNCHIVILPTVSSKNDYVCEECKNTYSKSKLDSTYQFFMTIPITQQLQNFIDGPLYDVAIKYKNKRPAYADVFKGRYCEELKNKGIIKEQDFTLQFNTDGVQMSNSSKWSLWPLQLLINELPYNIRRSNVMLCALWFSKEKPDFDLFLRKSVEELQLIGERGIQKTGTNINVKFHVVLCSVDSIARPLLQNIKQFNGAFGCSFCLAEGSCFVENANTRIYPYKASQVLRTSQQHFRDAEMAFRTGKTVNGVKGPSVLWKLRKTFDITKSFSTDYLHNVCLGVVKYITDSWFDSSNHNEEWYLGTKGQQFDEKMMNILPPSEITRPPRSITERAYWKASEWRNFLLYYSVPVLSDILPKKYINHWCLLVRGVYLSLQSRFEDEATVLQELEKCLSSFVSDVGCLYGQKFYTFNMHLLLHIRDCISNFGALWSNSTFIYEHYNGVLGNLFNNSNGIPQQMIKNYFRIQEIQQRTIIHHLQGNNYSNNVEDLMTNMKFNISSEYNAGIALSQTYKLIPLSRTEKIEIENELKSDLCENAYSYVWCRTRGMLIHSEVNCKLEKRMNSAVFLRDGTCVVVLQIFKVFKATTSSETGNDGGNILFECEKLHMEPAFHPSFCFSLTRTKCLKVVLPEMVTKKIVLINFKDGRSYGIPLVNHFERD